VRPENEEAPWLKALEQAISTQEMKDFILQNESFAGGVIPTFEVAAE
jgi:ABC-type metal ion transport system substrate-binding protein